MQRIEIQQIILRSLEMLNQAKEEDEQIVVSPEAKLFGREGQLSSMDLVALLVDIEEALQDADLNVTLNDEKAMSQSRSPFRDVPSLIDYIDSQIQAFDV